MASGDKYSVIGVRLETIRAAQSRAAKFWCKGYELQQGPNSIEKKNPAKDPAENPAENPANISKKEGP